MSQAKMYGESIFRDRRSAANARAISPVVCRRQHARNVSDARPWWLKVNYVSQDSGRNTKAASSPDSQ